MKRSRGSILIYTLWILNAVSFLLMTLLSEIKLMNISVGNFDERYKFLLEAHAVSKIAIMETVRFGSMLGNKKPPLEKVHKISLKGREYTVRLEAEDGKYPVTIDYATSAELQRLFGILGIEQNKVMADSLLDFQDTDNLVRLYGAERDYYMNLNYSPPNKKLRSLEELLWIKGFDFRIYGILKPYVTVYTARVNLNYAPAPVLYALGFSESQVTSIENARKNKPLTPMYIKNLLGARWNKIVNRISLLPLPSMYRAKVVAEKTGEKVELILTPDGRIIDVLWY